ncbi:MAG: FtsX-like permease family protein [Saprospiraceae bacterium]|nr:FtsX-like permease family protein [Saprospiraceae bacterium]
MFAVFSFVVQQMRNYQTALGFDTENVWIAEMDFSEENDSAILIDLQNRLRSELLAQPEIESVAFSGFVNPFDGSTWQFMSDDNGFSMNTHGVWVDENYAKTAGLTFSQGRWYTKEDFDGKYQPVVINQKLYEETFKGRNLKDSVYIINGEDSKIIGVVEHYKYHGEFSEEANVTFFGKPMELNHFSRLHIRLKGKVPPVFEAKVSKIIAEVTKRNDAIIKNLENRRVQDSKDTWVPIVALLSICGFLILNVALGLFGVLWYNINKRKAEIGLRRTLGATKSEIATQFIGEVLLVSFFGIFIGLFFAFQLPLMKVFEIENINYYYSMLFSGGLILVLVLICAFYPSRQAAKIHPALALHEE